MGDLVAVMEVGGHLAQFGPPDEILAKPASDFVARFVGADRGLKRLSLTRVGDLELTKAVTARPGDSASEARRRARSDPFPYLLLVDERDRPIGWVAEEEIPLSGQLDKEQAIPMSPLLGRRTTLKDALAMMIEADVQAGVVVDKDGKVLGLVTLDAISDALRGRAPKPAAVTTVASWEEAPSMRDGGDQEEQTVDQKQPPARVAVGPGKSDG
jgi:osmoprotectant transport system ATP-binding protein